MAPTGGNKSSRNLSDVRELAYKRQTPRLALFIGAFAAEMAPFIEKRQGSIMILEVAPLQIIPGQAAAFEQAFEQAQCIISTQPGYAGHQLQRSLTDPHRYLLLVNWQRLEDHTQGFRGSPQYQEWKALLHHFYDPFPTVEHFQAVQP